MPSELTHEALVDGVASGDRRAIARALSLVEDRDPRAYELVKALYGRTGSAYAIGVTGPPGVGKSSLIAALVGHVRAQGRTVGVVSVDPTSPFSHGAVLGDRIRLADHFLDPGVFIRSMATRGHLGGLAEATLQAALVLDAAGKELLFVETVGIGQSEVEIAQVADTVVLVLMPGSGDSVQALKAGVMEIPDVIAVNKRDHPHARTMLQEVRGVLALAPKREWGAPIVLTEAITEVGVDGLWEAIQSHRAYLEENGRLAERRRARSSRRGVLRRQRPGAGAPRAGRAGDPELRRLLEAVERRELDPLSAVRRDPRRSPDPVRGGVHAAEAGPRRAAR